MCIEEYVHERSRPQKCLGVIVAMTKDSISVIYTCVTKFPKLGGLNRMIYFFSQFCELTGFSRVILLLHVVWMKSLTWLHCKNLAEAGTFKMASHPSEPL